MRDGDKPDDCSTDNSHTFISFEKLRIPAISIRHLKIGRVRSAIRRHFAWHEKRDGLDRSVQHHLIELIFWEVVLMRQGRRYGLSAEQRTEVWRRWKAGESLHEIGRFCGKDHGSIQFLLSQHGGIVPAVRRRSLRTLTLPEREEISRGIASGLSIREIARGLQRATSTVSREVTRHGGRPLYRASEADDQAWKSALRPRPCLLARHRKLRTIVASKLIVDWSPEQISGWLKIQYPNNESMRVSHETIYRSLFIQARGVLKKELVQHLRSRRFSLVPRCQGL